MNLLLAAAGCDPRRLCCGVVAAAIDLSGGGAIRPQPRCRDESQATSEKHAVLAGRKVSNAGSGQAVAGEYRWSPDTVSYDGWRSLTAEVPGKWLLFALGQQGASTPGGTKVAEIGPVPPISASEYLLRVNYGSGPPGAKTPVHSHSGFGAFYVIAGKLGDGCPA